MPTDSRLHFHASEAGNFLRPPVVLIHGAGGHHLYWPPQIRRLHDQRVFALDLPGHGKSDGIGRHRVADYAQDVLEFLNERRLNAAVWIGHSMGGAIALEAALRFPKRVLGLVLIGSGARLRVDPVILHAATQEGSFPAAIRLIAARSFAAATAPRLKELASQRMEEIRPSVLLGDLLACDEFDAMDGLALVRAPTLIVCGSEDQMTPPRFSSLLHERIQGSRLQLIAHAGHMVMLEQPDEVAAALESFLGAIPYEPGR
jgi:pimeloyl-ACP methyl ester carboxylesterase